MLSDKKYYFAYGSNMPQKEMSLRCPQAIFIDKGKLRNYRFMVNREGYGSIIEDTRYMVYGVVWSISSKDEIILDEYEEISRGLYEKRYLFIETLSLGIVRAFVYIATNRFSGSPRKGYVEKIIESAAYLKFPESYIKELREWQKKGR